MKKTPKQIAALVCVVLLVLLYVAFFLSAVLDFPGREKFFSATLYGTIAIPLLTWIYIFLYGKMKNHRTIASVDLLMTPEEAAKQEKATESEEDNDDTVTFQKKH